MTEESIRCREAIEEVVDYLKGEVTPESAEGIRKHLEHCRPCEGYARFEQKFLDLLEARLRGECCPDRLKERIRLALDELD